MYSQVLKVEVSVLRWKYGFSFFTKFVFYICCYMQVIIKTVNVFYEEICKNWFIASSWNFNVLFCYILLRLRTKIKGLSHIYFESQCFIDKTWFQKIHITQSFKFWFITLLAKSQSISLINFFCNRVSHEFCLKTIIHGQKFVTVLTISIKKCI